MGGGGRGRRGVKSRGWGYGGRSIGHVPTDSCQSPARPSAPSIPFPAPLRVFLSGRPLYFVAKVCYGFKVKTLEKLSLLKSNEPSEAKTLLHYVCQMAEDVEPEILELPSQLAVLYDASRVDWTAVHNRITELDRGAHAALEEAAMPDCQQHQPADLRDFLNDLTQSIQVAACTPRLLPLRALPAPRC